MTTITEKIFEAALGIAAPWTVAGVDLDAGARTLTIRIDFVAGSRFAVPGEDGVHPVHDTVSKRFRHLNFFQHERHLPLLEQADINAFLEAAESRP